jgi:hypothetical protein
VVAALRDSWPRDSPAHAGFAHLSFPVEDGISTQYSEVMQRLNDCHAFRPSRIIGGGRDQRESIVEVRDPWAVPPEQSSHFSERLKAPYRPEPHIDRVHRLYLVVVYSKWYYVMPVRLEKGDFGGNAMVLAAWLLIEVVRYDDVHI